MTEPFRIYLSADQLRHDEVELAGDSLHHLQRVLRAREGDELLLLDGAGLCCRAHLEVLTRQTGLARISRRWQSRQTALPVMLLQALPKGDKFDLVLKQGTELGITAFQPLASQRSIPSPSAARLQNREERWLKIIREAGRQSRRDILPRLCPLQPLPDVLGARSDEQALKLVLWEEGARPLVEVLPPSAPRQVMVMAGPEGGFAAAEMELARAAGFQVVHLGPRILRTETAGLAVTPILQYLYGDWGQAPGNIAHQPREEQR